jgi:hypothetical protein
MKVAFCLMVTKLLVLMGRRLNDAAVMTNLVFSISARVA